MTLKYISALLVQRFSQIGLVFRLISDVPSDIVESYTVMLVVTPGEDSTRPFRAALTVLPVPQFLLDPEHQVRVTDAPEASVTPELLALARELNHAFANDEVTENLRALVALVAQVASFSTPNIEALRAEIASQPPVA